MLMRNIHGLEDTIVIVSALLSVIYKSNIIQMKIPTKIFVVLDKLILILMLKKKRAQKVVRKHNKG